MGRRHINLGLSEKISQKSNTDSILFGSFAILAGLIPGAQGLAAILGAMAASAAVTSGVSSTISSKALMSAGAKGAKGDFAMSLGETLLSAVTVGGSSLIGSTANTALTKGALIATKLGAAAGAAGGVYGTGHTI